MAQTTWATLPQPPKGQGGRYVRKFEEGTHKYRITGLPATYWEYFNNDNKPVRSENRPSDAEFKKDAKEGEYGQQLKFVRAIPAYDYQKEDTIVLQLDKNALIDSLFVYANDPERGDPTKYDIKITRTGQKKETRYALVSAPPKELTKEIQTIVDENPVNVSVLIDGGDPFVVVEDSSDNPF